MTLTEAVKALPDTPDAIADFLLKEGCEGVRSVTNKEARGKREIEWKSKSSSTSTRL